MFVRPNQFRNSKADVQIFYGGVKSWTKPLGVSQVYMMLIGGGSGGDGSTVGGNSGNITTWFGSAQNVPDFLVLNAGLPNTANNTQGNQSAIAYSGSVTPATNILIASGGNIGGAANTADTATVFGNTGFYQNVLGQVGSAGVNLTASTTTFLSGGDTGGTVTGNYGYVANSTSSGFFQLQPIIVGVGGSSNKGGIGCGSGSNNATGFGGDGLAVIITW